MKIAFVLSQYLPSTSGGVYLAHVYARRLVALGHTVTVFTTDAGSEDAVFSWRGTVVKKRAETIDGVFIRRFPVRCKFLSLFRFMVSKNRFLPDSDAVKRYVAGLHGNADKGFLSRLLAIRPPIAPGLYRALCDAREYDFFYVDTIALNHSWYAYCAAKKLKKPLVISPAFHAADKTYYHPRNIAVLRYAAGVLVYTAAEKDIFVSLGVDPLRVYVVGGCIPSLSVYKQPDTVDAIRRRYRCDAYASTVLFISRLQDEKGVFDVIAAIKEINRSAAKPFQLIIAGADFGGNGARIQDIAAKDSSIIYRGRVTFSEKVELLHACDILCVPSVTDSFGLVYIEAWACKKPVIVADIPSSKALVDEGEDGFCIKYHDIHALADKIALLTKDRMLRLAMGNKGYQKVAQKYLEDAVFKKIYAAFEREKLI